MIAPVRPLRGLLATAALLLAAVVGCGGLAPPGSGDQDGTAAPAPTPVWGAVTVPFPGPAAERIATDGPGLDARRPVGSLPAVSPCLQRAAEAHVQAAARLPRIPAAFTDRAVSWAGCPDAAVTVATVTTGEPDRGAVDGILRQRLAGERWTHMGIARSDQPVEGRWHWYLLLVRRRIELRPVPSAVPVGASLTLQLRLEPGLSSNHVVVTRPDGEVEEAGGGSSGGWLVAGVTLAEPGTYWIEVFGEDRAGPEVLALFPVTAGAPSPALWAGTVDPPEALPGTPEEAEAASLRLLAETRRRFGRRPLTVDPELTRIARRYSEEQAAAGHIAHVSPTSGSVVDRLRRGGYAARFAAENLAQAGSVTDAHDALLRSPGHRAAMLDPYMTHVGIGVAWSEDRGQRSYFVTQIFTRPLVPADAASLAAALRARLAAPRPYDAQATAAAEAAVTAGAIADPNRASSQIRRLERELPEPLAISLVTGTAFDAGDVRVDERVTGPRVVGLGIAVGPPSSDGAPLPYLLVVLTLHSLRVQ